MQILTTRTYKYRCCPTKSQVGRLENHFSMCRHLYNWSLKERIEAYENLGITVNYHAQAIALPALRASDRNKSTTLLVFGSVYGVTLAGTYGLICTGKCAL